MVLAFFLVSLGAFAVSPADAFAKGKAKIEAAKSLSADFSMTVNGQKITGKLYSKGTKFAINTDATSSWYDGKDLYTFDPSAMETFIFRPTPGELAEVNPLLYLSSSGDYKVSGSKAKKTGLETVVLIPKKAGGVKSVTIDLDAKTFLPKIIKIMPSSGGPITIAISGLKVNPAISDSQFSYPKAKYPKATITDMR